MLLVPLSASVIACSEEPETERSGTVVQTLEECSTKLLQPSLELIRKMKSDGLDLSKPRSVTHLLVGEDTKITSAAPFFKEKGFDVLEVGGGRLLLGDEVPLSEEWALDIVPKICSKASEIGLIYDGWDVDVSKDGIEQK
jgi:Regulator of ribonuclease activity B